MAYSFYSNQRGLYIDSILLLYPHDAYILQQRAMPLFKQKKYEIGMTYLDSAVKYDTKQYIDYRAFIKCIFQKKYSDALKDFKIARLLKGNAYIMDHTYDFYSGLCYLQLNKYDSAQLLISKTIEDEEKKSGMGQAHFLHYFYEGVIFYEKGEYQKAIDNFDYSLKAYSHFSDAKYYKAYSLYQLKENKKALESIIEADKDFADGFTINEDNAIYETYPYQVNKNLLREGVKKN